VNINQNTLKLFLDDVDTAYLQTSNSFSQLTCLITHANIHYLTHNTSDSENIK